MSKERFIVHVDMDAFFAAVEQRDNPKLRGKPVVVGADPKLGRGRGVVSTCSYEARKFGIHSAMPISIAYNKCPHAVFLPVDMEKYSEVSHRVYQILYDFTPDIEPVGIDEAFLDITGSCHLFGTPLETCLLIKSKIKSQTGLTASAGLAPTKMAAKIASDLKKPDGMVEVKPGQLLDFLRPLGIRRIWGLGAKAEKTLNEMGICTIGDLAKRDPQGLVAIFGKNGMELWQLANGIDERGIVADIEAKSISNEVTFDADTADAKKITSSLVWLCEKVSSRLRDENLKGRTVTLKIRLEGFRTYTRASTLSEAADFDETIYREIKRLFEDFPLKGKKVRLVGVRVSGLVPAVPRQDLFEDAVEIKTEKVHKAIDEIRRKFGERAIHRAGGVSL